MAKYINRLKARLAMEALRESAREGKNWIVSKKLILEADDMDIELDKGETVEIGATPEGDMAIGGKAAVVVISDADLAKKIADVVVSADEMSDVKFMEKPALDAMLDGENVEDVIDDLAGAEGEDAGIEVAEVEVDAKESVEAKFAKFDAHRMDPKRVVVCESILIDEEDNAPINLHCVKADRVMRESFDNYDAFIARVVEMKGSLQPGKREVALSESGKVIGAFDKESAHGIVFLENEFENVEAMDGFDAEPTDLMQDVDLGEGFGDEPELKAKMTPELAAEITGKMNSSITIGEADAIARDPEATFANPEVCELIREYGIPSVIAAAENTIIPAADFVEPALGAYEESAKTGADYAKLLNGLKGLKESTIAQIVSTFDNKKMTECVRVFDSKLGKYCAAFKESVDADNFIEETKEAKRFTKRFFS